jgi:hypothetical protein
MAIRDRSPLRPPAHGGAGVTGNSRLTATTGALLTLLLLVEGFTVLNVRGYITLHTALGLTLIGPVALKAASTMYRFARYYTGHGEYVRKGPPHPVLRILGPLVLLSSVALLGTGVVVLTQKGGNDTWITLHQASFIVWIVVTGLHFLGHLREAVVDTARELRPAVHDAARRGHALRLLTVAAALLVGIGLAAAFTPSSSTWKLHDDFGAHSRSHH